MFVLSGYDAFLGFLLIAAAVPVLAIVTNKIVAPRSRSGERDLTYESGMEPIGGAWIQFNIRYYMFALVFVVFDVETVFLYPWAVAFHRLGLLAFIEALVFIAILTGRLPVHQRALGRKVGLGLALITRLMLLATLAWRLLARRPASHRGAAR